MSIRVDVQLDHGSESLRWIATATLDGKRLHEIGKHGGLKERDEVAKKMAEWLEGQGRPVPDHYRLQKFTPQEQWVEQPFPN